MLGSLLALLLCIAMIITFFSVVFSLMDADGSQARYDDEQFKRRYQINKEIEEEKQRKKKLREKMEIEQRIKDNE